MSLKSSISVPFASPVSSSCPKNSHVLRLVAKCAAFALCMGTAPADTPQVLTTMFASNNGSAGNMFDIVAAQQVQIVDLDINLATGSPSTYEVYTIPGSFVGNENNPTAWTLVRTGNVTSYGSDVPTPLLADLDIVVGTGQTVGIYVAISNGSSLRYTNGSGTGPAAQNGDMTIPEGIGISYPFGSVYSPRIWNGSVHYQTDLGAPYCYGDGTGAQCPCGNLGAPESGCSNTAGYGANLRGQGSASVFSNDLRFTVTDLLADRPAMLIGGTLNLNAGQGTAFGDGLGCVGGSIYSLGVRFTDSGGAATWRNSLISQAGLRAGETHFFQVVYRDGGLPCGSHFNTSNGVSVTLEP